MKAKQLIIVFAVVISCPLMAQSIPKITGPLGVYHIAFGYTYADSTGTDSLPLEQEIPFGDISTGNDFGLSRTLDSCGEWNVNKVLGIILPPTEGGVYNQPGDTSLLFPDNDAPGMIQGAQRFSRLSQLCSGVSGVILDDWNMDTGITHKVYDAVKGKPVDAEGNVYSTCPSATPYNKLYIVVYNQDTVAGASQYVDGLSLWNNAYQNCCYTDLDGNIDDMKANWPDKEILVGIYIYNRALEWTDPGSVQYMLEHAINRYDDGDINGIQLFRGLVLLKDSISISRWNSYNLPYLLDSLYYPYLGEGQGTLNDCNTGTALTNAFVSVYCAARSTGDTLLRGRIMTNSKGQFQCGLWAGNRTTDSTYYWLITDKSGYIPDTVGFWINRNDTTVIPSISLCPAPDTTATDSAAANLVMMPNPTNGSFIVQDVGESSGIAIQVYDMQGRQVYTTVQACTCTPIDVSFLTNGMYLVVLTTTETQTPRKGLLMLEH